MYRANHTMLTTLFHSDGGALEVWYRANPAAAQPVFRSTLGELFESSSLHLGAGEAAVRQQGEALEPSTLRMPSFLSDNMVLQRGNASLWGWAAAGERIKVTVSAQGGSVLATATGVARLVLVPSPSWPLALYPTHSTAPLSRSAQT